jgi:dTDP-4-amino-4,6-dideoxygalactose transaminase
MYRIPLFDLNVDAQEEQAVLEVLRDRWISMGPRTELFERRFGELLGTSQTIAVSNCTAGLHLALRVLGIGPGDEVIVPSLTFVATVAATRYVGAVPVFCDICGPEEPTLDPERVSEAITPKTRAIVVMHYAGFPCDMDALQEVARRHQVHLVEDAAHAPGSRYKGRPLGTIGDIGCFSFFSNKNVTTAEGGMVVTRSPEHYRRIKLLRSHAMTSLSYDRAQGHSTSYDVVDVGYNYRTDDIRSAIGLVQLDRLAADIRQRNQLRQRYVGCLRARKDVTIPFVDWKEPSSNYILPIVLNEQCQVPRDIVRGELAHLGIQTSVHYPAAHRFSVYQPYTRALPNTEYVADRTLTLPMYPNLRTDQVDEICEALTSVLGARESVAAGARVVSAP